MRSTGGVEEEWASSSDDIGASNGCLQGPMRALRSRIASGESLPLEIIGKERPMELASGSLSALWCCAAGVSSLGGQQDYSRRLVCRQ